MNRVTQFLVVPAGLGAALILAAGAHGQNALGDGGALDANPQVGSGGRNLPGVMEDFRARNRIVTGEVGDAREFRGDVGYVGERAFTSPLPSDEFFRFRADSAASSVQSILSGATLDRFNLAARGGVFAFDRDFTPPRPGEVSQFQRPLMFDRADLDLASRASGFGRILERSSGSALVSPVITDDGDWVAAVAGPVTGLRFETMPGGRLPRTDMSMMDHRALHNENQMRLPGAVTPGAAFSAPLRESRTREPEPGDRDALAIDGRIDAESDQRIRDGITIEGLDSRLAATPDYREIVKRIVAQYGDDPNVTFTGDAALMDSLRRELELLRDQLIAGRPIDDAADRTRGVEPTDDEIEEGAPVRDQGMIEDRGLSEHLLRSLRHGRTVDDLTITERSRLADILGRGESLLMEGQFMLAEHYFDRALRIVPQHPLALAGLVNTQIGAGLYLSAAVNLHQLLALHPEMIDTRYGERIMPPAGRLETAVSALRNRLGTADRADRSDYGLLLAFLGHQTEVRDHVFEGLEAMRRANPDAPLLKVLEEIWLGE